MSDYVFKNTPFDPLLRLTQPETSYLLKINVSNKQVKFPCLHHGAYREAERLVRPIINLALDGCGWLMSGPWYFTVWKETRYRLNRRLGWYQKCLDVVKKIKIYCTTRIQAQDRPVHSFNFNQIKPNVNTCLCVVYSCRSFKTQYLFFTVYTTLRFTMWFGFCMILSIKSNYLSMLV